MQIATESSPIQASNTKSTKSDGSLRYALTIFCGAFLLFQVQLLLGKYILPWFGGSPAVWTTCMLFFQVLLLGGYLYSHLLSTRLNSVRQARVHRWVLLLSVLVLGAGVLFWKTPLLPNATWRPSTTDSPVFHILLLLAVAVGLPYLCLSTTGPLLQSWFARSFRGRSPYRLYALSNFGSLLGLVTYPFLFEPWLRLHTQAWIWFLGYLGFVAGSILCTRGASAYSDSSVSKIPAQSNSAPAVGTQILWFLLPAFAALMLLATTNLMCQEVAVIPFLWVLPLSLYLASFIICFDSPRWYRREIFHVLLALSLAVAVVVLISAGANSVIRQVWMLALVLFASCMVCHGELARLKPDPAFLTRFYLLLSAGGAAGGILVALVAPRIFDRFLEFHFGLIGCVVLAIVALIFDRESWWYWGKSYLGGLILLGLFLTPYFITQYSTLAIFTVRAYQLRYYTLLMVLGIVAAIMVLRTRNAPEKYRRFNLGQMAAFVVVAALCAALWQQTRLENLWRVRRDRNFYGVLTIKYVEQLRTYYLRHGQILHGSQSRLSPAEPTLYFTRHSGIGRLLESQPVCENCGHRYGIIGLGVGTLAAYGRRGDEIRFYEINPQVVAYSLGSNPYFTYLRDSAASVSIVPGDARLSLERELRQNDPQKFDVFIVDAFSSDAIPVHLLTQGAFELYLKHLRSPDSVLAFHISNGGLNLRPVLAALAAENHLSVIALTNPESRDSGERSEWVLLSRNPASLASPMFQPILSPMPAPDSSFLWTDDYSNLFRVLRH